MQISSLNELSYSHQLCVFKTVACLTSVFLNFNLFKIVVIVWSFQILHNYIIRYFAISILHLRYFVPESSLDVIDHTVLY